MRQVPFFGLSAEEKASWELANIQYIEDICFGTEKEK
jgi:hypothetical protein